jgi:CheY-like chemotaxis protein
MARILVVDDSRTVCALFTRVLSDKYEVKTSGSGEEALELLSGWTAELALVDINLPGIDGFETLSRLRERHPNLRTALITGYDVDAYITLALEKDVSNIIVKATPFDGVELMRTVDNLLNGERLFGLANYMDANAIIHTRRVLSTQEVPGIRDDCLALLKAHAGDCDITSLCVVFEETLSNAIYHAHGYQKLTEVTLKPDQVVEVAYGCDTTRAGIAVTDHSGRLTKKTVLKKIIRASGDEGLYDEDGRGLFVSRAMSDRMVINIQPGKRTEIIALKFFGRDEVNRPLYINQLD